MLFLVVLCLDRITLEFLKYPIKVYNQQIKKLNLNKEDKKDVIKSEKKFQRLICANYVSHLKPEQQKMIQNSKLQN